MMPETVTRKSTIGKKLVLGFGSGLLMLVLVSITAGLSFSNLMETIRLRGQSYPLLVALVRMESLVKDAETGQRGFLLTGRLEYLQPYQFAMSELDRVRADLHERMEARGSERGNLEKVFGLIDEKTAELRETIDVANAKGSEAAIALMKSGRGKSLMDEIHKMLSVMSATESAGIRTLNARMERTSLLTLMIIASAVLLSVMFQGGAIFVIWRDIQERSKAEAGLGTAKTELERQLHLQDMASRESRLLTELLQQLQACQSAEEAYQTIAGFMPRILPDCCGAIYAYKASRNAVDPVSSWCGEGALEPFTPDKCWALRRGTVYEVTEETTYLARCAHVTHDIRNYVCAPMLAQGEPIGLLHCEFPDLEEHRKISETPILSIVTTIANHVAMALANLRLRESLRQQSIRDPLTGLFNRRFMEESLDREIHRALRNKHSVCLLMIDLDRFKQLNDNYGHEGGDTALKAIATLLKSLTRAEDVVCRYGGEELIVILPDADLVEGEAKAESLRQAIEALNIEHGGRTIRVTASIGIAASPDHGETTAEVSRAADSALYQAKGTGRNRVVVSARKSVGVVQDLYQEPPPQEGKQQG